MAIVLSLQENIDLLLFLVKLAIAIGTIAIALLLLFWLRLKKIEKRIYLSRKQLRSRFTQSIAQKIPQKISPNSHNSSSSSQVIASRPMGHLATSTKRSPKTQVYISTSASKLSKKTPKRSSHTRWQWLLAIAIASIMGIAIALMQIGNSFISPEYTSIIWLLIGVTLVMSATLINA